MFHCLKSFVEQTEFGNILTPNELGILMCLSRGPRTVPQLVDTCPFSRQYIQKVVYQLIERGFVERFENPSDKRSYLIKLTHSGIAMIENIRKEGYGLMDQQNFAMNEPVAAVCVLARKG